MECSVSPASITTAHRCCMACHWQIRWASWPLPWWRWCSPPRALCIRILDDKKESLFSRPLRLCIKVSRTLIQSLNNFLAQMERSCHHVQRSEHGCTSHLLASFLPFCFQRHYIVSDLLISYIIPITTPLSHA